MTDTIVRDLEERLVAMTQAKFKFEREAVDAHNRVVDLESALRKVRLRIHWIGHLAERFWTDDLGTVRSDWREEIAAVEIALFPPQQSIKAGEQA